MGAAAAGGGSTRHPTAGMWLEVSAAGEHAAGSRVHASDVELTFAPVAVRPAWLRALAGPSASCCCLDHKFNRVVPNLDKHATTACLRTSFCCKYSE
jgi:hypothetical protein